MDAIFGKKHFLNEIIWCYSGGGRSKTAFAKKHDSILSYTKSKNYNFYGDSVRIEYNLDPTKRKSDKAWGSHNDKVYAPNPLGKIPEDWWIFSPLNSMSKERTGYPTQKPLELYERIILASSKKGDIVLDPFAGCATTCVAAEKLERNWVGIDFWDKAHGIVIDRLKKECYLESAGGGRNDLIFTEGDITYSSDLPTRTDDGETASPFLRVKEKVVDDDSDGEKMSREKMVLQLLKNDGCKCQGCFREFDSERYLELDHKMPRADGGSNRIKNRVLLCAPCNKLKRHYLTLSGLRRENKKFGYMAK